MHHFHLNMTVNVDRKELLETLKKNRESHRSIVQEAREGYVKKAQAALEKRLEQVRTGKVVALTFSLKPPVDYTSSYDTAIQMLEWSKDDTIEMASSEFRKLVEDEWDWTDAFLLSNSAYSAAASLTASNKGLF